MDVDNLISGSSAFSKTSFYIWKFTVHVLSKPSLENFGHYFASMWNECSSVVVWTFFGITLLWDWNENWSLEVKGKGEKERYTHLNTEFQRIARRDKKAFLSDLCKEIEENNRMGKTRDLFKKIRYTKGIFHAKMGLIKDRNCRDLTEDTKRRWQEYTEELYKKELHDQDNHDGVITHLEPDILECEVKSALGSITMNKASGGDGIPVELFQNLKDDAVKMLHSICHQIWKTQQWP